MDALNLEGAAFCQLAVQMLASAAERLTVALRFLDEALSVGAFGLGKLLLIKVVAISGDVRQERRKRDGRIMSVGSVAAGARRHQEGSGQDGRRLAALVVLDLGCRRLVALGRRRFVALAKREQGVERDLLKDKSSVVAGIRYLVRIPLAKMMIRSSVDRMVEIVGTRVESDFV